MQYYNFGPHATDEEDRSVNNMIMEAPIHVIRYSGLYTYMTLYVCIEQTVQRKSRL